MFTQKKIFSDIVHFRNSIRPLSEYCFSACLFQASVTEISDALIGLLSKARAGTAHCVSHQLCQRFSEPIHFGGVAEGVDFIVVS